MLRTAVVHIAIFALAVAFPTQGNWTQLNGSAFTNRSDFALTTWRGAVWLTGGGNYSDQWSLFGDVLRSEDGADWVTVLASAPWTARAYHATAASSDDTTLILAGGGRCVASSFNSSLCPEYEWFDDVWAATAVEQHEDDADSNVTMTWRQLAVAAPWSQRGGHSLNVLAGAGTGRADLLVLAAGLNSSAVFADVWGSSDGGATWTVLAAAAPFGARAFHATAVLPASDAASGSAATLVLIGGAVGSVYLNDVWVSQDGVHWRLLAAAAPFSGRYGFGLSYVPAPAGASNGGGNGTLWLTGGAAAYPETQMADVWVSPDGGVSWAREADGTWAPRSFHATAVLPAPAPATAPAASASLSAPAVANATSRLVLVAGWNVILPYTYHYLGDVWALDIAA